MASQGQPPLLQRLAVGNPNAVRRASVDEVLCENGFSRALRMLVHAYVHMTHLAIRVPHGLFHQDVLWCAASPHNVWAAEHYFGLRLPRHVSADQLAKLDELAPLPMSAARSPRSDSAQSWLSVQAELQAQNESAHVTRSHFLLEEGDILYAELGDVNACYFDDGVWPRVDLLTMTDDDRAALERLEKMDQAVARYHLAARRLRADQLLNVCLSCAQEPRCHLSEVVEALFPLLDEAQRCPSNLLRWRHACPHISHSANGRCTSVFLSSRELRVKAAHLEAVHDLPFVTSIPANGWWRPKMPRLFCDE